MTEAVIEALGIRHQGTEEPRAVEGAGPCDGDGMTPVGDGSPDVPGEEMGAIENGPSRTPAPAKEINPAILAHFRSLQTQAEELRREFPDFELSEALRDPAFLRLTAPALGVGVREAYYALHREQLDERAAARGAEQSKRLLARAVSSGGLRPREGGGLETAALTRSNYRELPRGEQQRLKQRILEAAARGEKIYP